MGICLFGHGDLHAGCMSSLLHFFGKILGVLEQVQKVGMCPWN